MKKKLKKKHFVAKFEQVLKPDLNYCKKVMCMRSLKPKS